ncbi:MAG: TetR family transcriptional regulator [Microbacterium sp. 69-10]|uniref:TetR/AcrR family transcriptional regulator n=1 Tax=Microbacterium sp. 69-10 TaxID=1895783 RepID=UPI0009607A54|nr:TetR/AcrR family transcriptional regulator [Microbacterium sp. 69-10]OJU41501.1 MAG: TetR family transcriptional regulator [Microbacterium sp. 69-10]
MSDRADPTPRKRGRPTAAERAQRLDDLLDAAIRLFAAKGLAQVSIDEIAAEARVTKRTIYAHYGDRNDVFLASIERLRDRTVQRPATGESLEELAVNIVMALHSDEAIGLHRLMIIEAARFPELANRFYQEGPHAYIHALNALLPAPDEELAASLFSLLLGEPHRLRLLGLQAAPDATAAASHALAALRHLHITSDAEEEEQ